MKIHIPADFTLDELQAFIEGERQANIEGFYTTSEWASHFGISKPRMREILSRAKEKGLLEMAWLPRVALDGKLRPVPVYALKKEPDE